MAAAISGLGSTRFAGLELACEPNIHKVKLKVYAGGEITGTFGPPAPYVR